MTGVQTCALPICRVILIGNTHAHFLARVSPAPDAVLLIALQNHVIAENGWQTHVGLHRIELEHSTLNKASCRVAVKAHYLAEGTKRSSGLHADGWHDMHQHAQVNAEFEAVDHNGRP